MISCFTSYNLRWTIYKAYTTNVSLLSSSSLMESDSKGGIENDSFVILILLFISSSWVCRVDSFNVSSAFSLSHSSFSSSCSSMISSNLSVRRIHTFLIKSSSLACLSSDGSGSSAQWKKPHCWQCSEHKDKEVKVN